jgi:hypothetical protein
MITLAVLAVVFAIEIGWQGGKSVFITTVIKFRKRPNQILPPWW